MLSEYQIGHQVECSHGHNSLFSNSWSEDHEVAKLYREFTKLKKEITLETLRDPVSFENHQKTLSNMIDTFTHSRNYDYVKELINYVVETESKVNQQMQYGEGEDDYNCSDPEDSNFSDGDLHHYEPLHPMHLAVISNGSDISISSNSDDCNDPHMLNDHYSAYYQKGHLLGHVNKNDQNALRKLLPPSLARRNKSFEWCHQCKQRSERVIHCGQGCNKKFCTRCLYRHYGEQETDIIPSTWLCPYCKKICCCAYCRKLKAKSFGPGNALSGARIKRSADSFIEANNMKRVRLTYSNNEIYDEADYEESEEIEDHLQADEEEEDDERMAMHSQSMNKPLKEIRTAVTVSERSWEPSNTNNASLFQLPHVSLQLHAGETDHALAPEIDHHEISREMPMTQIKTEQQHPQSAHVKPTEDSFDQFMGWHPKKNGWVIFSLAILIAMIME